MICLLNLYFFSVVILYNMTGVIFFALLSPRIRSLVEKEKLVNQRWGPPEADFLGGCRGVCKH